MNEVDLLKKLGLVSISGRQPMPRLSSSAVGASSKAPYALNDAFRTHDVATSDSTLTAVTMLNIYEMGPSLARYYDIAS